MGRLDRGMVINEVRNGTTIQYSHGPDGEIKVSIEPSSDTEVKTLLAIRGDKLYFLSQMDDQKPFVLTEKIISQAEIDEALRMPGYARVGDRIVFTETPRAEQESYGNAPHAITVLSNWVSSGSVSASNIYCDRTSVYGDQNVRVIRN